MAQWIRIYGIGFILLWMSVVGVAQETGRVHVGGYGAIRFESTNLEHHYNTFTFRRFVLTTDVAITNRLRFLSEIEFERFRLLELEKKVEPEEGVKVEQAIEGTGGSEIAIEQAWLEWAIASALRVRAGGVLMPLGRFNINHDDNRWIFPRRSLVDRGAPVLPVKSAWNELGIGFTGEIPLGEQGLLSYQAYVVNGMVLDVELENKIVSNAEYEGDESHVENIFELKFEPFTGTFGNDSKSAKTFSGRLAYSPTLGLEVGLSGYYGRYTPQYLDAEYVGSAGVDFLLNRGSFALEGQYIYTSMGDIRKVAEGFAGQVHHQVAKAVDSEDGEVPIETEVEFELKGLTDVKRGYWVEARYAFFPAFLKGTFLADGEQPQWYIGGRWEQVWYEGMLEEAEFSAGRIQAFEAADRQVNRLSLGLTYRPTPLVGFQLAYERTWTDEGQSLKDVVNFLIAEGDEDTADAFLFGVVFGF